MRLAQEAAAGGPFGQQAVHMGRMPRDAVAVVGVCFCGVLFGVARVYDRQLCRMPVIWRSDMRLPRPFKRHAIDRPRAVIGQRIDTDKPGLAMAQVGSLHLRVLRQWHGARVGGGGPVADLCRAVKNQIAVVA